MLRNNINAHWQYACGLLNEVLSLNAQESPMAVPRLPKILVLNEVLSLNAQEFDEQCEYGWFQQSSMKS